LRRAGGFTLIEMMLALVIGTMIMTAASAVFMSTMNSWDRGSKAYAQMQAADKIAALIEKHLRAAESPAQDKQAIFEGVDLSTGDGQYGHRLTLISTAPGRFPRNLPEADECEIAFEYDPSLTDGMSMRIQCPPDDVPDDGGYLVDLSPLIAGFRVIYFDGEKWVDEWSDDRLPQAVEFTLVFKRAGEDDTAPALDAGASATGSDDGQALGTGPILVSRLVWLPAGQIDADRGAEQQDAAAANGQAQNGSTPNGAADENGRNGAAAEGGQP
jgi:prepilin-type N-terminal cleavage/methylation domain-containing protein